MALIYKKIINVKSNKEFKIFPSKNQTKKWRIEQEWYNNGKHNECEKYQIEIINTIINKPLEKSKKRFNCETQSFEDIINPLSLKNGYEYTENMDGYCFLNKNDYYFNLKFICDQGGAQNRSLREVYTFIKQMYEHIYNNKLTTTYFINILDGDCANTNIEKIKYLSEKDKYKDINKYVYIGVMYNFVDWWKNHIK